MNQVLDTLGHRDKVYEELEKLMQKFNKVDDGDENDPAQNEDTLVIFG